MIVSIAPAQYGSAAARNSAMAAARGEVDRARTQLRTAVEKVRSTWKANPQWIAATDEATAAQKDYQAARNAVVDKLKREDPTYKTALDKQGDLQDRVQNEQGKTNASQPASTQPAGSVEPAANLPAPSNAQVAAASEKLNNKAKLRNMEDIAVTNDAAAAKAEDRLNKAQTAAKIWQAQFDAALKNDPDYRAALDQMTAARSRMAAAAGTPDAGPAYDNYGEVINVR
ncbi:MAG: hypothetical protein JWM57_979 [Phycisphaerales bacterium]|nr:hypothetical protein [Phycisphaerales bacterium]